VDRGWESPARAELLRELSPLITAAAEGDPRDPVPWRIALDHARGTNAGHAEFERLWGEAVRRSPHHYGCHVAALQYLSAACCAQWGNTPHTARCSHRECFDFAEPAAQDALPGSLVQALPVRAAFACLTDGCGPTVPRARLDAAADLAIALSATLRGGRPVARRGPQPADLRPHPPRTLDGRPDQLRLIGPYATSFPWDRISDDPLGQFLEATRGDPPERARRPLCGLCRSSTE
jgi:hypothetical protein